MINGFFRAVAAAGFAFLALPASSATMTFVNVNDVDASRTYSEDGIVATTNYGFLGAYANGAIHFDDGGTAAPGAVRFSMASNFDAISFLLDPIRFNFFVEFEDRTYLYPTYLNVLVQGFREGALVSNLTFNMGSSPDPYLVNLTGAFNNISSLVIGILTPDLNYYKSLPNVRYTDFCVPCSHFNIDNVTLAPVPVPAGLPLLATGLGLLTFVARRRKFM